MFIMRKAVLRGVCAMIALACLTLPCAAQAKKKNPPAKKNPPQVTIQPVPNPAFPSDFNPFFPQPMPPFTPNPQPNNRVTKPSHTDNVSDFLRQKAMMDALVNSTVKTYNPLVSSPIGSFPMNPYQNPMMNPFMMQNPMMNPFQNQTVNLYQNPMMNPYQNPMMNQMNPFQNPMMNQMNPFQNQMMNPFQNQMNPFQNQMNPFQNQMNPFQNQMLMNQNQMMNPFQNQMMMNQNQLINVNNPWAQPMNQFNQANPFRYNPAMLPGVGIFGGNF